MWIHHYEPESERQSMEWKHASPVQKFKSASVRKNELPWYSQGPILKDYQERV
jgi:hypothetical protein